MKISTLAIFGVIGILAVLVVVFVWKDNFSKHSTSRETFTAAVVDYHPFASELYSNPEDYMLANAVEYTSIIKRARKLEADIIVFPECGLTSINRIQSLTMDHYAVEIPTPVEPFDSKEHDFTTSQKVLKVLATAAKESNMYVVVNLPERVNCSHEPDCPQEKFVVYNTNIVFNRNGCIISRYRKFNLYGEKPMIAEKDANVCTFETDFKVTFGMFICFDILFGNPSLRLITEKGISNIIFSTAWFAELPFLTANAVQAGWAHSMDVNFLGSGYRNPETGSGGSGIYNGSGGALTVTMPFTKKSELLIAKLPIKPKRYVQVKQNGIFSHSFLHNEIGSSKVKRSNLLHKELYSGSKFFADFAFKTDLSLNGMSSLLLEPNGEDPKLSKHSHLSDVSAEFNASISVQWKVNAPYQESSPRYRLFLFDGLRSFDFRTEHVSVCGLVVCRNETVDSCGLVPNLDSPIRTTIDSIVIHVKSSSNTLGYLPITMDFNFKQLRTTSFTFSKKFIQQKENETECIIKMDLIEPTDDLFVFSVYKIPG